MLRRFIWKRTDPTAVEPVSPIERRVPRDDLQIRNLLDDPRLRVAMGLDDVPGRDEPVEVELAA